ncbi:MAG: hypothetical protein M3Q27_11590 [Actinomycetota bacterium]|nr:hypothetical protein [Actinomycetota bacterium]
MGDNRFEDTRDDGGLRDGGVFDDPTPSSGGTPVGADDVQADREASGADTGTVFDAGTRGSGGGDSDAAVGEDDLAADIERSGGDLS